MSAYEVTAAIDRWETASRTGSHDAEHDAAWSLAQAAESLVQSLQAIMITSEEDTREAMKFTVLGVWEADEPISVGVIGGHHKILGGETEAFPEGLWQREVTAGNAAAAEMAAKAKMLEQRR